LTELSGPASATQISGHAAAKINLFLHVTGRREDGYHELDSLVGFTAIGDHITVDASEEITLSIGGPFGGGLPVSDDNLVLAAARLLAEEVGFQGGAAITLQKNLPVSSGIGGGSADAAATLQALNQLWDVGASREMLATIGLRLGADVPVCLHSKTARMSGIGDIIHPLDPLPDLGVLLVNPGVAVSTPQVFKARKGAFSSPLDASVPKDGKDLCEFLARQRNDLQVSAIELVPEITTVLETLSDLEGCRLSRLSGSGATCFGLFDDQASAIAARDIVSACHADWWVQPTHFLN
jgi:4-diphosphocytidyl-2-C-methyl-D-erythritol kinase